MQQTHNIVYSFLMFLPGVILHCCMTPNGVFLFRTGFCRLIQLVLEAGHDILSCLLRIIQKKCFDLDVQRHF